ncbi:hypothetical protein B0H34DRAFT_793392 [Crassisporium funariophilum]|nr:hypothetical protein B0H34DRAFT_793392 [Crassisporium funariophilum]
MLSGSLTTPAQLIGAISDEAPNPVPPNFSEELIDAYEIKLSRYLCGKGHPIHPSISNTFIMPAMYAQEANNLVYRAKWFLKCATGLEWIPVKEDWGLMIKFTADMGSHAHKSPVKWPEDMPWEPTLLPFFFHTCTDKAQIPIRKDLLKFLSLEDPEDEIKPRHLMPGSTINLWR